MVDEPVGNANPPTGTQPHPCPVQQATLINANNIATDAPMPSGSSLAIPVV